jgi:phospholipid transport system substrate-binding protein
MLRCRPSGLRRAVCFGFLLAAWLVFPSPEASATAGAPTDVVRNFYGVLLDIMQHAAALGPKGRYEKLEPVVRGTFDVPFMARLSVGPTWRNLTPEQKRRAVQAYTRYIAAIYATHDNDTAWQIRDIYLSGSISELATRRSDFANILRTSGIDGLIASLNKKADDLQG